MTKSDIISQISEDFDISKAKASKILDTVFNTITEGLSEPSGEVRVAGFGKFSTVHYESRKGRNPRTGEEVHVPARVGVKFKMLGELKKALN